MEFGNQEKSYLSKIDRSLQNEKENAIRLTGLQGCEYIGDATPRTSKKYVTFVAQEDTVIGAATGTDASGATYNYVTLIGLASKTLKIGALITVPVGQWITNITVASGSIIAYNGQ